MAYKSLHVFLCAMAEDVPHRARSVKFEVSPSLSLFLSLSEAHRPAAEMKAAMKAVFFFFFIFWLWWKTWEGHMIFQRFIVRFYCAELSPFCLT